MIGNEVDMLVSKLWTIVDNKNRTHTDLASLLDVMLECRYRMVPFRESLPDKQGRRRKIASSKRYLFGARSHRYRAEIAPQASCSIDEAQVG